MPDSTRVSAFLSKVNNIWGLKQKQLPKKQKSIRERDWIILYILKAQSLI